MKHSAKVSDSLLFSTNFQIILKRCWVLWIGVAKEIVHEINLNTILLK